MGLSSAHCRAKTLDSAYKLLAPIISGATKGSRLYIIMRDLQVIETKKLLSLTNGVYLEALQEAGANGLVQ